MTGADITYTLLVDQTPEEAFNAVNHYSKQKITELIPGKKIVWLITDSSLDFLNNKSEWNGTKIIFDIAKKGNKTEARFTHLGIAPGIECYDKCSNAWGSYINNSLLNLITKGK